MKPSIGRASRRFAEVFQQMRWKWTVNRPGQVRGLKVDDRYIPNVRQIRREIETQIAFLDSWPDDDEMKCNVTECGRIRTTKRFDETGARAGVEIELIADSEEI